MKQVNKITAFVQILVVFMILPGCIGQPAAPFSMEVIPALMEPTIPGQRCVFLVIVEDEGQGRGEGEAVKISATAPDSTVTVNPQAITPEQVAEVSVIPEVTVRSGEKLMLTVTIDGEREELTQTATVTVTVQEAMGPVDELGSYAAEIRDKFIPWLATNHPEFGITSETEWSGTIVRPYILGVSYYLFFSEEWELGVSWHVMIPPHDWARIYLRHRTTEVHPSHTFEISSLQGQTEPIEIDPKDAFAEEVWR